MFYIVINNLEHMMKNEEREYAAYQKTKSQLSVPIGLLKNLGNFGQQQKKIMLKIIKTKQ